MDTLTIAYDSSNKATILVDKSVNYVGHIKAYRKLITEGSKTYVRVEMWRSKKGRVKNKQVFTPDQLKPKAKPAAKKSK